MKLGKNIYSNTLDFFKRRFIEFSGLLLVSIFFVFSYSLIKYSPENGNVYVGMAYTKEGHLKIFVRDEGAGIAPEDQNLIFEKFRQATGKNNPLVKGTGLGLAIAKAFVEAHEGKQGGGRGTAAHEDGSLLAVSCSPRGSTESRWMVSRRKSRSRVVRGWPLRTSSTSSSL